MRKTTIIILALAFMAQLALGAILSNDDGTSEDIAYAGTAGWEMAEWFYPTAYPCTLVAVMFYPANTYQLHWKVWDDNSPPGPPGEPLTVLASGDSYPTSAMDWWTIELPTPVVIPDGAFYIGWQEMSPAYGNGFDMTLPNYNQCAFHYDFMGSWFWSLLCDPSMGIYGDLMIRGVVGEALNVLEPGKIPERISISAYPNPFNSAVTIALDCYSGKIGNPDKMQIEIYDMKGRRVEIFSSATLEEGVDGGSDPPLEDLTNNRSINSDWIANRRRNTEVAEGSYCWQPSPSLGSGLYLIRATVGGCETAVRVVYLK